MPYKNKIEEQEAGKRYREKNKKRLSKKSRCKYIAKKYNPEVQTCSIENCSIVGERHHPDYSKPKEIIWLCQQHHREIHIRKKKKCTVRGCSKDHYAKGICMTHYNRYYQREYYWRKNDAK